MGSIDFNKLWRNFLDTVTKHYADFNGRVGRAQFWYYVLLTVVILLCVHIVQNILWTRALDTFALLALLLPDAGMAARRLQDTGRSGTLVWIAFIPAAIKMLIDAGGILGLFFFFTIGWLMAVIALIASVVLIYFCVQPGMPAANQYGPVPPVFDPTMATPAAPMPPPAT